MNALKAVSCGATLVFSFSSAPILCGLEGEPRQQSTVETPAQSSPPSVVCSPEQPTVPFNGSVHIHVWQIPKDSGAAKPMWTATAGTIQDAGDEITWNLNGIVHEGIYRARASVDDAPICSVRVVVVDPAKRGPVARETGRSLLIKGKAETEGYGLYSYCLLGSRPTAATRDRYLEVLAAYLKMIEKVSSLEEYLSRDKLNVTYVPLDLAPSADPTPLWLLDHYDYSRARFFLDLFPGERKDGIYLVSSLKPLAKTNIPPYLFQDLSSVPAGYGDLISWWIREFLNQAAQEQFWNPLTGELFALKLRTTLAVIAGGVPYVKQSLKSWINWVN